MPADHRLWPDDLQSVQHAGCQPIQPGKYQTVDAAQGQSLRRFTSQHVGLMTKRQHLCLQRRSRPEQSDQHQPNQAANISHQPRASPNSTSLAARIEFPTVTGRCQSLVIGAIGARPKRFELLTASLRTQRSRAIIVSIASRSISRECFYRPYKYKYIWD
jgi:hypothetical protein